MSNGKPYSQEADALVEEWENDRYLIDRRAVYKEIFQGDRSVSLFDLYEKTGASPNSLALILSDLIERGVVEKDGLKEIVLAKDWRMKVVKFRRELFFPKLARVWRRVPDEYRSEISDIEFDGVNSLPSGYRKI